MNYPRHPRTDPNVIVFDKPFWVVFLAIAILGIAIWLTAFEHNFPSRIYRYSEDMTILRVGDSELEFNHPPGAFSIWWQSERRNMRVWPR